MLRFAIALVLLAAPVASRAADVEFVRVWPQARPADFFLRISEYFTDHENTSGRIVVRSHPANRAGYYFLARVKHPNFRLENAKFVLRIITPGDPEPKVFIFPVDCPPGVHVFELGLTGTDWPVKSVHPVAWDLELLSRDGRALAAWKSYLWAKPDK